MSCFDRILQRVTIETHGNHVTPSRFHRLLNRQRYLASLTATETYPAITVTNRCQCGEAKDPTAFDHLCHAINLNELLLQALFVFSWLVFECHIKNLKLDSLEL